MSKFFLHLVTIVLKDFLWWCVTELIKVAQSEANNNDTANVDLCSGNCSVLIQ